MRNMNITLLNSTPIVNDLVSASRTLDTDPNNHKRKALLAGAATIGLGTYGLTQLRKTMPNTANKNSVLRALTAFAFPAGIYYAVKNRDSKKDIALGSGTAIGSLVARNKLGLTPKRPGTFSSSKDALIALPLMGALATGTYMADQLGEAKRIENNDNGKLVKKYPILNTIPEINRARQSRNFVKNKI